MGQVDGPTACLRFPSEWTLTVTEVNSSGGIVHQDTLDWTPSNRSGIYLIARSSTLTPLARTETFVPADASGWLLTFSSVADGGLPYTAHLVSAPPCKVP